MKNKLAQDLMKKYAIEQGDIPNWMKPIDTEKGTQFIYQVEFTSYDEMGGRTVYQRFLRQLLEENNYNNPKITFISQQNNA